MPKKNTPRPYVIHVYSAADGWRWRMKAPNGKVVADSGEAYATKQTAYRGGLQITSSRIVMSTDLELL